MAWTSPAPALSYALVVMLYSLGIPSGVLGPDDHRMREMEGALQIAERSCDDLALAFTQMARGVALAHRQTDADRDHGHELLAEVGDMFLRLRDVLLDLQFINVYVARERARRGDRDAAIPVMRAAVDDLVREGQRLAYGRSGDGCAGGDTARLAAADGDVAEAEAAIDQVGGRANRRRTGNPRHLAAAACGRCWRGLTATRPPTATIGIATAPWPQSLASRGTSRGPRRCHDGACAFGGGDVSVHRYRGFDPGGPGAGAGSVVRWLSGRVGPDGQVVAVDVDPRFLGDLGEPKVEARQCDIRPWRPASV